MQVPSNLLSRNKKELIKNYSFIVLGSILLAIGTGVFLLPSLLNTGGLMGLGLIGKFLFNFDPDLVVLVLTWTFFLISLLFLGWRFTVKSLISSFIYPLALIAIMRIPLISDAVTATFENADTATVLIAGIFGGVFSGIGVALTFLGGGSTGGVDIIVVILNKYLKAKHSTLVLIMDALIIGGGLLVTGNLILSLIGIISAFVFAFMIEFIFLGQSHVFTAYIISPTKHNEINDWIQEKTGRGATLIPVLGGYKKDPYNLIVVNFDRRELVLFNAGIALIDPRAFVTIQQSKAVLGEGFSDLIPKKEGLFYKKPAKKDEEK
ncbi:MAG TPA: YitT family protein [Bacilli bacterium]|nr:YitT family protein [Bacilli bacterium]